MKKLTPDLLTTSVQRREAFRLLSCSIEHCFIYDGRGIITFPLVVGTSGFEDTPLDISRLLFSIALLNLDVAFFYDDYFC